MRRGTWITLTMTWTAMLGPVMASLGGSAPEGFSPEIQQAIHQLEARIDGIEAATLQAGPAAGRDPRHQMTHLGKLLFFDKQLSVHRNEACAFCHMPDTGFTGPLSELNRTTVAYPGSVRTRVGPRKPQSCAYATFAPVLHYNALQGEFVGGAFWDMRATGLRLQSPAAEQGLGPPLNPLEMGFADAACVVYRLSQRPYRALFAQVWGGEPFAIAWPAAVEQVCATPGPPPATDPFPLHLPPADRARASTTYEQIGLALAAFEASPEVNAFSSKYDYVQAGQAQFTPEEQAGYDLFRGKAKCNQCHRDGGPGQEPLFTDFTAANLGLPPNPRLPYYGEDRPDPSGYTANPQGPRYLDPGVGGALSQGPDAQWARHAAAFTARFQVPTLRNVDRRPDPGFVKAYMHNGYLQSLKEVVHFYNTRDTLPRCTGPQGPREKVGCWPAPEDPANLNRTELGDLGLSEQEEDALVAFLRTLTDGYPTPQAK